MSPSESFAPDMELLLQEIPGDSPTGVSIRYEPIYGEIRKAREEDDASLPMGVWERPLKRADWKAVAATCIDALSHRSKDVQIAGWLCEAWIHLEHVEGVVAGADLLAGMISRYWGRLYPEIDEDDGDVQARIAPFIWMNETLPLKLKLQIPLLVVADREPSAVNLADWEYTVSADLLRERRKEKAGTEETRDQLIAWADGRNLQRLADMDDRLEEAIQKWDALGRQLDDILALDSPSLNKIIDQLQRLQRAVRSLLQDRDPRKAAAAAAAEVAASAETLAAVETEEQTMVPEQEAAGSPAALPALPALPTGPISNREEAYRLLEAAAAYLQRTEPHSPTPYLIRRAVTWGRMSLADLMQEIVREEGDLSRYFKLLGMNSPQR